MAPGLQSSYRLTCFLCWVQTDTPIKRLKDYFKQAVRLSNKQVRENTKCILHLRKKKLKQCKDETWQLVQQGPKNCWCVNWDGGRWRLQRAAALHSSDSLNLINLSLVAVETPTAHRGLHFIHHLHLFSSAHIIRHVDGAAAGASRTTEGSSIISLIW